MMPKSDLAVVTILGIMKSGAVYLPIDPEYPEARKQYILENSNARAVVSISEVSIVGTAALRINLDKIDLSSQPGENPGINLKPNDLAYLIYTSGSTGAPKGVMIEHRGNVNMSIDQIKTFGITARDKVLLFASLSFDASISELFMAFYCGAAVFVPDADTIRDTDQMAECIGNHGISVATFPPS
jgi:non-ribosomal peptide synthetase component F